jgi:hypothetical protein
VLTGALGAASLLGLQRMDAQAHTLADKWLVGVGHLAETERWLVTARELETKHSVPTMRANQNRIRRQAEERRGPGSPSTPSIRKPGARRGRAEAIRRREQGRWSPIEKPSSKYLAAGRAKKQQDAADISDGLASMSFDETIGGTWRS